MVRIKAKTMAAASYAPKNGYTPAQLDQCGNHYNSYFPPNTYQQPCPAHMPAQQLYDFTNEAWASAVTGYQDCADVSLSYRYKGIRQSKNSTLLLVMAPRSSGSPLVQF